MTERISIVPRPARVEGRNGWFELKPSSRVLCAGPGAEAVAELLAAYLRPATGYELPVSQGEQRQPGDVVLVAQGEPAPDDAGFVPEAYACDVGEMVTLEAESAAGLARAVQALRQLFPAEVYASEVQRVEWRIPCARIEDSPRFRWRGLHLDVARHFFSVEQVCRFIELLAMHRYNICHLHLTDDQGWRIEIRKYPRLTEIGSTRAGTIIGHHRARPRQIDHQPYGGYFTQDDIRTMVDFASRRHVTLVPEIDMPGHMQAAIAAYPELGNTDQTIEPRCHWGISQHVLNVEPGTVRFMQDVLDEVMTLFPGRFIHVGGDEAPKHQWSESDRAQQRMAELGLKSEDELQSWFITQMDEHVQSRGRRLIGWDEILEGGLAPGAAVMSWRGEKGGIAAAQQGHDVVMAPGHHVYFDHHQAEPTAEEPAGIGGLSTTEHVYAYEPVPAELADGQAHHVLGAQGQLWTEYIPTVRQLDYMTYPRACALAEVLWRQPGEKRYADFLERLGEHRQRLAVLGVRAHPRP
ncbi:MAG: beta-N-acetylhexosaminidase [Phycisphaeraceae bacterium]